MNGYYRGLEKGRDFMEISRSYDIKIIGENLRKLRLSAGYSVRDIRDYLGLVSVQSIYKFEKGICMPQAEHLLALMELYNVDAHRLVIADGVCGEVVCVDTSPILVEVGDIKQRSNADIITILGYYANSIYGALKIA